jgi:hypothetical protein
MFQNKRLELGQKTSHILLIKGVSGFWQTIEHKELCWKEDLFVWDQNGGA